MPFKRKCQITRREAKQEKARESKGMPAKAYSQEQKGESVRECQVPFKRKCQITRSEAKQEKARESKGMPAKAW